MKIFAGSSNQKLAQLIAHKLKVKLGDVEIIRFADSETRVWVKTAVKGEDVFVIQSTSEPVDVHLLELIFLGDALMRLNPHKLVAVVPYFGYQRQDKIHRPGECLSAKVVARLIEQVFDEMIIIDPHSELLAGFFDIPVTSLSAFSLFESEVRKLSRQVVIVAPDAGGAKRAQMFAQKIGAPLALIEKWRDLSQIHVTEALRVVGTVRGKIAIIVDDVYVSGGTTVHAAKLLAEHGAKEVISFATQPVLIKNAPQLLQDSPLTKVYTTDVIEIPKEKLFPKLTVVSVASMLASTIKNSL